ncbi:MAG: hypothetical protein CVV30_04880 [Methanomicrobiales archaeon HGW-Methanomicrobiales-1]|jgi:hypothetical protein|nr:MAG: hypothetical protein CVV30_04880 [Methanomicrobiales archaeon HGW-Methanomicrobiales-1]
MNAHELMKIGGGLVIAVFLAGCLILVFCVLGITGYQLPLPVSGNAGPSPAPLVYDTVMTLEVPLPASPKTVPYYRVTSVQKFSSGTGTALLVRENIPSIAEAPVLAEKALAKYGGLPADAVLERTEQSFMNKYNLRTGMVEEQSPQNTRVMYRQYVNDSPVMGSGITVSLGEGGELLDISKDWSTLEYAGDGPIISAESAWEKLQRQELLIPVQCSILGYNITRVQFGYHVETHLPDASAQPTPPNVCTPVWIFYGKKPGTDSEPFPLMVNATGG